MDLATYGECLARIPFGKRVHTAIYAYRAGGTTFGEVLDGLLAAVVQRCSVPAEFNVIKFRTDELKVSFLYYPDFVCEAHPALREAITVDLARGKARRTDYASNLNPPILHRKESFLPAEHPLRAEFEALTRAEEQAGLYENTSTIGFRLNWERLLESKGLKIVGHLLVGADPIERVRAGGGSTAVGSPAIERHKTALVRYELSKPVKTLLEYGVLRDGRTFFDYGCGQGSDVRGLQALGHVAEGWDPVFRPEGGKRQADVVNFGFVLNVIEDPAERLESLVDAYRHARGLLVVSALVAESAGGERGSRYWDGVVTKRNTFQKYFEQHELQQYIEDALETTAVPVALGVFYVFREPAEQQDFLSARSRRAIDWTQISARLGLGAPGTRWTKLYEENKEILDSFGKIALKLGRMPTGEEFSGVEEVARRLGSVIRGLRAFVQGGGAAGLPWEEVRGQFGIGAPKKRRWETLCEEHAELLDSFWSMALGRGRLPEPEEFPRFAELRQELGSAKRAMRLFILRGGADEFRKAAESRRRDLLVYLALANLRKRVPFGQLSFGLRSDIRAFFGNYTRALKEGLELLFAAGDTGEVELACEGLEVGWQDEQALYVHRALVDQLPPVLRAYVGCATALFGDVAQADVIKLHKSSGKVTFLVYDDFEGKALPELRLRIKVNLRTRWVQVFDHSKERQALQGKERFLRSTEGRQSSDFKA